jgi:hypothetical protein
MNTRDALKLGIDMGDYVSLSYIQDLSDEELMERPHPECNHLNWQVGHLIASENEMMKLVAPECMPPLPPGFAERYSRDAATSNDPAKFCKKEELLRVQKEQRAGTLAALAKMRDEDFDKPTGVDYAPTVGAMLSMQGSHWLMHCGQWVIVRRRFGRPPLF